MKRRGYLFALAVLLTAACCLCAIGRVLSPLTLLPQLFPGQRCADQQPPAGFESDLIGTWQTSDPNNLDTLILREDHKYKQTIHRVRSQYYPAAEYESDWQRWWVQYNPKTVPYLHLEGMHPCIVKPWLSCDIVANGGADPCVHGGFVSAQNQGILLIVRRLSQDRPYSLSTIDLVFARDSEGATTYTKQLP